MRVDKPVASFPGALSNPWKGGFLLKQHVQVQQRVDTNVDKQKRLRRGIFILLAVGTLPSLFMNPAHYFFGLLVCGGIATGMAWVLS